MTRVLGCYDTFYWFYRHCGNRFRTGFVADITVGTYYALLIAAEVFEHLVDPVTAVREMINLSPNVFICHGTTLYPCPSC